MINELYCLASALDRVRIQTYDWHPRYGGLPNATSKSPCFRFWLQEDGTIKVIDTLGEDLVKCLRKFGDNQGSFPAFNIVPLFRILDERQWKQIEGWKSGKQIPERKQVENICMNATNNWVKKKENLVNQCLKNRADELISKTTQETDMVYDIVVKVADISRNYTNSQGFQKAIIDCVLRMIEEKRSIDIALMLLFHHGNQNKESDKDVGANLSIILDYVNWLEYGNPVASSETTNQINSRLMNNASIIDKVELPAIDAFNSPYVLSEKKMPEVKLPGFKGNIKLRSMFSQQPCQERYERFEDDSYFISTDNRAKIKRALEYIADEKRENITWTKTANDEITFAYTNDLNINLNPLSMLIGLANNTSEHAESIFTARLKDFSRVFSGMQPKNKPKHIYIFSLRKMDNARTKVVYTHICSPQEFLEAAEEWEMGCKNIPDHMSFGEISIPSPLEVYKIINMCWKLNGTKVSEQEKVKRMKFYQGIDLLLDKNTVAERNATYFLHVLLDGWSNIFLYLANKLISQNSGKSSSIYKESLNNGLSMIGLLLYKNGIVKEDYMENAPYLIGQLLKVSDELHTMYCKVVRKGEVPSQLVGNSVFSLASEVPMQALAQLAQRMSPYISWAKQYRTKGIKYDPATNDNAGITSGRANNYLILYENIATKLAIKINKGQRFNEYEKAELFLGYLAVLPETDWTNK
jgi:hypothetical protein